MDGTGNFWGQNTPDPKINPPPPDEIEIVPYNPSGLKLVALYASPHSGPGIEPNAAKPGEINLPWRLIPVPCSLNKQRDASLSRQ